ncbi:Gfo/Idh/MocA family oxidoreductase [candidate division KSB1 bacterium]|nr:Gfo/Idh/MocA family oxidoreductase [candidate division KSB1 bacterium]RQW04310.1 MAG: gfo/Idh/MocA family oxidoreductase [candidate division KSB1 bacterium]
MMNEAVQPADSMSRRHFVQTSALAASSVAFSVTTTRSYARPKSANDKLGIGVIGVGGRGNSHLSMLKRIIDDGDNIDIVAVCDIYRPRLERAAQEYHARAYMDHNELIADPRVDIVCIATPDHIHGYQAIDAAYAGKDIYCEKPVTHWRQFELTKRLAKAVAESNCVFQLGTQAMSDSAWQQMKKLVQDGLIGQPLFGETGFFRIGDWGERDMPIDDANATVGADLLWEKFLGDAPRLEFNIDRFFRWRLFEDYAGGPVTDLYPHSLTQVIDILGVGFPDRVVALGGIHRYDYELREVPDTFNLLAQYPENVTISVLGTQANDYNATTTRGAGQRCPVIRGWDGSLSIIDNKEILFTPLQVRGAKPPQRFDIKFGEDNIQHWRNLIQCSRERNKETWSPMPLAYKTQTVLHMAMLAYRKKQTAQFDHEKEQIVLS